ncbi:MAG: hypothetical protein ABI181_06410 [Mycobacteriaceae bacterium]
MRRPVRTIAVTAGVLALLAGCSSGGGGSADPATTPPPSSASVTAPATTTASPDPAKAACETYAAATGNPRQVVLSASTKPVLGPAVALVTISFRNTVAALAPPSDPQLSAAFAGVVAALDELSQQFSAALPKGADPVSTPVKVDPSRLGKALDDADAVCSALGVTPKPDTATTASAGPTS